MQFNNDWQFMSLALDLASRGINHTSPNPLVGCVIVQDGKVVGQGYHQFAGGPHAEVNALKAAGTKARGATAYITLEPCCHHGKTPPCTDAILAAGIKKIVIPCVDPNPIVAGRGMAILRAAGIEVEIGLGLADTLKMNRFFFHFMQYKRPYVIAKWAMSLDGKTITHPSDSRQITGSATNEQTHQLRQTVDAILIGAKTAREDDPKLTARLANQSAIKQPLRIILSTQGNLPLHLKLLTTDLPGKTMVFVGHSVDAHWRQAVEARDIEVIPFPTQADGKFDILAILEELGRRKITSLLVEGGRETHEQFFAKDLVNEVRVLLAPVYIGALPSKQRFGKLSLAKIDDDYCFTIHDTRSASHV